MRSWPSAFGPGAHMTTHELGCQYWITYSAAPESVWVLAASRSGFEPKVGSLQYAVTLDGLRGGWPDQIAAGPWMDLESPPSLLIVSQPMTSMDQHGYLTRFTRVGSEPS